MAINFPATPTLNQTYTYNGRTWTYNNVGWQATGSTGLTVYTKTNFTATAAQTSFSVTYTVGFVDVYYNGSKLSSSEYTATTGSTVVLGTACSVNDIVETIAWTISSSFNPSLGSASATSLAIGGATIGSNALAVTGTTALSGLLTAAGGVSSTLTTDASSSTTGSIITAGGISTQKALWVGTTSRLVGNVQADANVGIGTSTNYAPLAVNFANPTGSSGNGVLANFRNSQTGGTNTGAFIGFETGGTYSWIHGLVGASGSSLVWVNGSAAEKMRLDLNGNLMIGGTTNYGKLNINSSSAAIVAYQTSSTGYSGFRVYNDILSNVRALEIDYSGSAYSGAFLSGGPSGEQAAIATTGAYPLVFGTSNTFRGMFDSSGNLLINKTVVSSTGNGVQLLANGFIGSTLAGSTSATDTLDVYSTAAGAFRFYVDMGGTIHATSATITAISDRTLKTNIRPLDTGLKEIMGLQPRRFDWINGDGENVVGFVAQEVEEVLPELVTSSKYSVDENGDTVTKKAVKTGDMIPTLVKAIQELTTRLAALEAK